jgi:putative phosphoesterase
MKLLIASDIHGDLESLELVLKAFKDEGCDRLLLLGDLLYHGPRNDLPTTYAPKKVIELLNANKDYIMNVKGNCDGEVDQMVLDFPIMADYCYLSLDGLNIFATHGHIHNTSNPPPLRAGEILLHGHTHVLKCEEFGNNNFYLNPGSPTYPKEGNPKTYMLYENRCFTVKSFDGEVILEKKF